MRSALLACVTMAGCAVSSGNTMSYHDAGRDSGVRSDTGLAMGDAGDDAAVLDDAGADTGPPDAGTDAGSDAGSDGGRDAGRDAAVVTPPVVDGVVGSAEWAIGSSASSTTVTIWMSNELRSLRAVAVGGTLYVAVEGRVESGNAMVVYVDGDPGGSHGITDLALLTDSSVGLDNAISAAFTQPTGFRADLAWGTTLMSHLATGADSTTGFRDITAGPADFGWQTSAPSACTSSACEASIPTSALGPGPAPRTIALFARITSANGSTSPNQTLPMDDASMPRVVVMTMTIHE